MTIILQFISFHCNSSKQVLNKVFLEHLKVKRWPSPHTELYKIYKLRITIYKPNQREFADSFHYIYTQWCLFGIANGKKCECKSNIILLQESTSLTKKICTIFPSKLYGWTGWDIFRVKDSLWVRSSHTSPEL